MYITDLNHFLDEKGAIAAMPAPARRLAEFLGRVVSVASAPTPLDETGCAECRCNKCKKGWVIAEIATDEALSPYPRNAIARLAILRMVRVNPQNQADSDPR